MGHDDGACDCQTETGAAGVPAARPVGAVQAFEQVRQVGGVDAGAVVRDGYCHLAIRVQLCGRLDPAAGIGVLQRVVHHDAERLAHAHPVEIERRQFASLPVRQLDPAQPCLRLPPLHLRGNQLRHRSRLPGKPQLARVAVRQPVQVAHQVAQHGHFPNDTVRPRGRVLQSVAQPRCLQLDHAERGVQLVGDVVDQPSAQVALGLQRGRHAVERRAHLAQFVGRGNRQKRAVALSRYAPGYGAPNKAGTAGSHGAPLGEEEIAGARKALGWDLPPFELPEDVAAAWREAGRRSKAEHAAWRVRRDALPADRGAAFDRAVSGGLPDGWQAALDAHIDELLRSAPRRATRQSSGEAINVIAPLVPELIGGSADLTGSNNTLFKDAGIVTREDFSGRYIHYGVREHGMAAAMNGMALHGGIVPYSGTFLIFSDYLRPALRLAALMGKQAIHVLTHDSIGLGEDGPTHQPVEHLASLRAMPNVRVFRPADAVETAECWAAALACRTGPSVLALTRQALPALRGPDHGRGLCGKGGYVMAAARGGAPRVALLATGSEVSIAMEARTILEDEGIPTQVSSLPCWELFEEQPESWRRSVLGGDAVRIGIEAACGLGWDRYIGADGAFIGMTGFGASAPQGDLYKHFGLTAEAVADAARARAKA